MGDRQSPSRIARGLYVLASVGFLGLAGYSLWLDRSATAAIAGALSFAFLLLIQLPYLESLEVLTLKVKLRERLSDAERLTDQLRTTASVSAQLMYVQLAFMNRMGSIPWARKRLLLAEVEQNLSQLNVPSGKIDEYKRPFLNIVSFDLYLVFKRALDEIVQRYLEAVNQQMNEHIGRGPIQAGDAVYEGFLAERKQYISHAHDFDDVLADPRLSRLRETAEAALTSYKLNPADRSKLEGILQEVAALSEECWTAGTVTVRTEEYLNNFSSGTKSRLRELEGK